MVITMVQFISMEVLVDERMVGRTSSNASAPKEGATVAVRIVHWKFLPYMVLHGHVSVGTLHPRSKGMDLDLHVCTNSGILQLSRLR